MFGRRRHLKKEEKLANRRVVRSSDVFGRIGRDAVRRPDPRTAQRAVPTIIIPAKRLISFCSSTLDVRRLDIPPVAAVSDRRIPDDYDHEQEQEQE
jgi:hypothetical protein